MNLEVVSEMSLPQKDAIAVHMWAAELLRVLVMRFSMATQLVLTGEKFPAIL